jgi:hypothetical protein
MLTISTDFADPPPVSQSSQSDESSSGGLEPPEKEPVVPLENPPTTLIQWAVLILNTPNPTLKVIRNFDWLTGYS